MKTGMLNTSEYGTLVDSVSLGTDWHRRAPTMSMDDHRGGLVLDTATAPFLGPAVTGTLVTAGFEACVAAYVDFLSMRVIESDRLDAGLVNLWSAPGLVGARYAVLASESEIPWIRVIEDVSIQSAVPFKQQGWMSLEVAVQDVDLLANELKGSPFETCRPPADLEISEDIRAMQVIGPAGEVLYLTQVKGAVPPFEIPMARCRVDHLFIPVMCCTDRDAALAFYRQFPNCRGFQFDTTITSVNTEYGYDLDRKHAVAAVQLAGKSMIEIDQIDAAMTRPCDNGRLPPGISVISFEVDSLDSLGIGFLSPPITLQVQPYLGRRAACCRGAGGELVELIERR